MSQNGDRIELESQVIALAGTTSRGRGTMLWFNEVKDLGALRTDEGTRIEVPGEAFSAGEKPRGRCAGLEIEFQVLSSEISGISFVPVVAPRRARKRSRR
jgi:hypothetical protein